MQRGGAREGAGRKPLTVHKGKKYSTISLCALPEEIAELRARAENENKSVSRYVFDKCLK